MKGKSFVFGLLGCSFWLCSFGGVEEFSKTSAPTNSPRNEVFLIRAFGGMLEVPQEMYFHSRSLIQGDVRFQNLGILHEVDRSEFSAVIRVGVLDDPTLRQIDGSDYRFSCYGFNQAIEVIEVADSSPMTSAVLFDDEIYVSVVSNSSDFWIKMLKRFSVQHNDPDANCLKVD